MPELSLHGRKVDSVFNLLGENENDITASIGWVLSRSPALLQRFLQKVFGARQNCDSDQLSVALQEFRRGGGVTDVEIRAPHFHVIIEAKRGWVLPSTRQLLQYVPRLEKSKTENPLIVVMSECSASYTHEYLPHRIKGIPVRHVSWGEMIALSNVIPGSLTQELRTYLTTIVNIQKESNLVYVVALGEEEWLPGLTLIQVVEKRHRYFHPYARRGWPKEAPNYLGFRYRGLLQSVHHVESAQVIKNFHLHFRNHPNREERDPYFLYKLGKPIRPHPEVRSGPLRNSRRWAMLDLLLTSETVEDACAATRERRGEI